MQARPARDFLQTLARPLREGRFVGHRARVRSPALGGRRVVEIVAVPDDEHVTLRPEQGGETTLRLDEISEATLLVDRAAVSKRRPDSLE